MLFNHRPSLDASAHGPIMVPSFDVGILVKQQLHYRLVTISAAHKSGVRCSVSLDSTLAFLLSITRYRKCQV